MISKGWSLETSCSRSFPQQGGRHRALRTIWRHVREAGIIFIPSFSLAVRSREITFSSAVCPTHCISIASNPSSPPIFPKPLLVAIDLLPVVPLSTQLLKPEPGNHSQVSISSCVTLDKQLHHPVSLLICGMGIIRLMQSTYATAQPVCGTGWVSGHLAGSISSEQIGRKIFPHPKCLSKYLVEGTAAADKDL